MPPAPVDTTSGVVREKSEIFISYMREDAFAARAAVHAIEGLGGSVWLDKQRLSPGDAFDTEIMTAIQGRAVRLFVPIISAHTEREDEGYVFQEWMAAVERARRLWAALHCPRRCRPGLRGRPESLPADATGLHALRFRSCARGRARCAAGRDAHPRNS